MIQIELASLDPRTFGSLAACYRQLSTLRERRGLEAEPELAQGILFVGLLCAVPHRFGDGVPIHPRSVVRDAEPGVRAVEAQIDADERGARRHAVVDDVGDGLREVIPEIAQGVDETARRGKNLDGCH